MKKSNCLYRWFQSEGYKLTVRRARTVSPKASDCESEVLGLFSYLGLSSRLERLAAMIVLLVLGTTGAWGQTDFSGVWYIANETNHDNTNTGTHWYLVPGANPQKPHRADAYFHNQYCNISGKGDYTGDNYGDPEKPFLTTYQTNQDLNSIWIVVSTGDGYYNIIHAMTGKYIVYEPPYNEAQHRKSMHLESTTTPGDNAKFTISGSSISDPININPKNVTSGNMFFNPAAGVGNRPQYYGTGDYLHEGMIGLYSGSTDKSQWYFEDASSATSLTPVISDVDGSTNTFTITSPAAAFSSIRYTTDESTTPDASTGNTVASGSPITITSTWNVQAVGVFSTTFVTPVAGPKELSPVATPPTISYNNATGLVTISSAAALSYYYTTNGDTPTTSTGTLYETPFPVTTTTTVKAIAIYAGSVASEPATLEITQVATPTIQNNGSNAISITTTTPSATIYYTTDDSTPTTSSTLYEGPLTENVSNVTIKAIAVKENMITSAVGSGTVMLQCATPVITRDGLTFTLSCSLPADATLYYSLDGGSEVEYNGTVSFTSEQLPMTVTAVARHSDYTQSETASMELKNGTGTPNDPYLIYGTTDFANFITNVNAGTTSSACYKLEVDVSGSGVNAITTAFTGTFDGGMHTISELGHALFNTVNGGTVKNVILDNVTISSGTNVGAICNEATGASRIYNCGVLATTSTVEKDDDGYDHISSCSSTISGSGYVGGIVGSLGGSSRVINCFSYANVSGGTHAGGIVGYNNVATTANNLQTMVMNCMFYGEVSGGSIAPIYNGEIITNDGDADGVNNFNYFRLESAYIQNTDITKIYNCALGAETRFLQRFEFFRHLLNSNRELAAWWASTSTTTVTKDDMMKWVMEPTQIGTTAPYPILKTPDKYASVVNYTPSETAYDEANRNKGRKLTNEGDGGVLHVTIQMGSGGAVYSAPSGASLKSGETGSIDLTITDKDYEHYNFNYAKVQLPYYNDYCDGNYTENRVVTGWKIVEITGGTAGNYTTGDDVTYNTNGELTATPYNFADRKCTNKDLYGTDGSNRVFNQGAYWDVPEGVTAITIEPYWGKAVYLADAYWDVVYKNGTGGSGTGAGKNYDAMTTATNVPNVGGGVRYNNSSTFNGQVVFTFIEDAISSSKDNGLFKGVTGTPANQTVYDYAVVLVGNYHHTTTPNADNSKPYTVTSVDSDGDNEPDYSFILRFNGRLAFHPVRYDFLNLIGLGMAQKTTGGIGSYNLGIMQPKAWFEVTNTALFRVTQFEYSKSRTKKPYILQGGVIEQWVTQQDNAGDGVEYFHIGGNVWFKEFHRGSHQDNTGKSTPHPPLSVTGGDFAKFYLTGYYQSQAAIYDDNAECYINGGRFGEMAGAGMEGIGTSDGKGNITWVIDNADIKEFYGGGINHAKPVHGNIHTIISNSHVNVFCGGPKFGDMASGRTVTTTATNCTFDTYFGAGYGGNSYFRYAPRNHNNIINFPHNDTGSPSAGNHASWNKWLEAYYNQDYNSTYYGVSTQFDYQFLPMSSNTDNVARIFVEYVGFSLATCRNVTSSLTGCTVTGNFYGGGSLGKVEGDVTSTLTNCEVNGSVFGSGYSASLPDVEVMDIGFATEPYYYEALGTYRTGVFPAPTTYTWQHGDAISIDKTKRILYTTEDLNALGTVSGNVKLNITGNTLVEGKVFDEDGNVIEQTGGVFGGGDESKVTGTDKTVTVNINQTGGSATHYLNNVFGGGNKGDVASDVQVTVDGTSYVSNNVFGGGKEGDVGGSITVNMTGGTVNHDVYGGGALANTNIGNATGYGTSNETIPSTNTYTTTVNLHGGKIEGKVFGGGLGRKYKAAVPATEAVGTEGEEGYVPATPAQSEVTAVEAKVYGNVLVKLNETVASDNCKVLKVFGCNNLNGTPKGEVTVHVFKTVAYDDTHKKATTTDANDNVIPLKDNSTYDVTYVYGGGNEAAYVPVLDATKTNVIIDGCDLTSIEYVYGGGNAASVPATKVTVNGCYEIGSVFGGGNGFDDLDDGSPNPGANVGYEAVGTTSYGSGESLVELYGGTIHYAFGGSNTLGNVRTSAIVKLDESGSCNLEIDEVYGAGNKAEQDGTSEIQLGCVSYLKELYGGSREADINSNVVLTIQSGSFDRVFGGNNVGGTISGTITVNVEETGCHLITIGQLYGGGNQAAYTGPWIDSSDQSKGRQGPTINVRSFSSIGEIYGGGYGETAVVTGNTSVNVNVCDGNDFESDPDPDKLTDEINFANSFASEERVITFTEFRRTIEGGFALDGGGNRIEDTKSVAFYMPTFISGQIGKIHSIYGGGNAAKVVGNTNVNIGTRSVINYVSGNDHTDKTVKGADIIGNVFGGGNQANVTGDTNVVIGR